MLTGCNVIVHECPLRIEWKGRVEVIKLQLDATSKGYLTVVMRHPETEEFLGEWDRECGGGLHMFGVCIDRDEEEYIALEVLLFKLIDPIFPYFFDYEIKKIMQNK